MRIAIRFLQLVRSRSAASGSGDTLKFNGVALTFDTATLTFISA